MTAGSEDHKLVQGRRSLRAAAAGPDADCGSSPLDDITQANVLVAGDEARKPNSLRDTSTGHPKDVQSVGFRTESPLQDDEAAVDRNLRCSTADLGDDLEATSGAQGGDTGPRRRQPPDACSGGTTAYVHAPAPASTSTPSCSAHGPC